MWKTQTKRKDYSFTLLAKKWQHSSYLIWRLSRNISLQIRCRWLFNQGKLLLQFIHSIPRKSCNWGCKYWCCWTFGWKEIHNGCRGKWKHDLLIFKAISLDRFMNEENFFSSFCCILFLLICLMLWWRAVVVFRSDADIQPNTWYSFFLFF